jgi:acyl carrier protein
VSADLSRVREIILEFLDRVGKAPEELTDDMGLYGEGLELDSLEAAELSALLEDEFGTDPFAAGDSLPETVGEIFEFYKSLSAA